MLDELTESQKEMMNLSDKTILIVDDEEAYRKFLTKVIEKFLKATVVQARNPKEAFEYLADNIPDLILLDLQMPLMDGQTALRYIRESERTVYIPVIVCSALGFESVISNLAKQKVSDFILKPCDASTIIKKVYRILSQKKENSD
jgi:CheY-like chemotaxis protein